MIFTTSFPIRFAHCDMAGIVFYPRYFELFNNVVEDWCEQSLQSSFRIMHGERDQGLPTVHVECDFIQPCELGELLEAQLTVLRLGNSSLELEIILFGPERKRRVVVRMVVVLMDLTLRKAVPIPDEMRQKMTDYLKEKP